MFSLAGGDQCHRARRERLEPAALVGGQPGTRRDVENAQRADRLAVGDERHPGVEADERRGGDEAVAGGPWIGGEVGNDEQPPVGQRVDADRQLDRRLVEVGPRRAP